MAAIPSEDTSCEVALRKALWRAGVRGWRLHTKIPGKPDLVFPRKKVAVFVDGCFWHGCPICNRTPHTRLDYWSKKIAGNQARDRRVVQELESQGWTVIRIWEHEIKKNLAEVVARIQEALSEPDNRNR